MSCFGVCNKKKQRSAKTTSANLAEDGPRTKRRSKIENNNDFLRNVTPAKNDEVRSHKPLYELKDKFKCLFCGGGTCKHEDWTRNKNTVIAGLNCDQINADLFASQRPSTVLILKYNLIKRFKELNIGLIVNVQRQGEHPYCGPNKKLEEVSGFTYNPESFTTEGIRVRLSGWKDMNVPDSIPFMLEIVKDMNKTVKEDNKTVLVHCHAGYGRTGIVLACFMIFTTTKSVEQIVQEIRKVRRDCIQKSSQLEYCKTFKQFINRAREIFTYKKFDIDSFIKHQVDLSYGEDLNKFQHVPKIVYLVFERILELKGKRDISNTYIYTCINGSSEWKEDFENEIVELKINMNNGSWDFIKEIEEISILIELCFDWLEDCVLHVIDPARIKQIYLDDPEKINSLKQNVNDQILLNKGQRKEITNYLKSELRMIEFETLTCIADFANKILPDESDKQKNEFHLMLEKIATYALGYNFALLYENNNKIQAEECISIVQHLIDIIRFFMIIMRQDVNDDIGNSFFQFRGMSGSSVVNENQSGNGTRKHIEDAMFSPNYDHVMTPSNKDNSFTNYFKINNSNEKNNSSNSKNFSVKKIKVNKKYSGKSNPLNPNSSSSNNNFVSNDQAKTSLFKPKEENLLYTIYNSLHDYFKGRPAYSTKSVDVFTPMAQMSTSNIPISPINKAINLINSGQGENTEMMSDFFDTLQNYMTGNVLRKTNSKDEDFKLQTGGFLNINNIIEEKSSSNPQYLCVSNDNCNLNNQLLQLIDEERTNKENCNVEESKNCEPMNNRESNTFNKEDNCEDGNKDDLITSKFFKYPVTPDLKSSKHILNLDSNEDKDKNINSMKRPLSQYKSSNESVGYPYIRPKSRKRTTQVNKLHQGIFNKDLILIENLQKK